VRSLAQERSVEQSDKDQNEENWYQDYREVANDFSMHYRRFFRPALRNATVMTLRFFFGECGVWAEAVDCLQWERSTMMIMDFLG